MSELKEGATVDRYPNLRWSEKFQAWIVEGETRLPEPITEEKE